MYNTVLFFILYFIIPGHEAYRMSYHHINVNNPLQRFAIQILIFSVVIVLFDI
jgi:hypothetical protein